MLRVKTPQKARARRELEKRAPKLVSIPHPMFKMENVISVLLVWFLQLGFV